MYVKMTIRGVVFQKVGPKVRPYVPNGTTSLYYANVVTGNYFYRILLYDNEWNNEKVLNLQNWLILEL